MKGLSFSTQLVPKVLDGTKTVTRRPIKPQPSTIEAYADNIVTADRRPPRFQPGETVYLKETWASLWFSYDFESGHCDGYEECDPQTVKERGAFSRSHGFVYKADDGWDEHKEDRGFNWRSPRFQPEWASRQKLLIVSVKAERLQEITEEDAEAEGMVVARVNFPQAPDSPFKAGDALESHIDHFRLTWQSIYAKTFPWESNPWVFVYTFKRVGE